MLSSSLKKTAWHLFQPIKLVISKSPTSATGCIICMLTASDSASAVAAPLELEALLEEALVGCCWKISHLLVTRCDKSSYPMFQSCESPLLHCLKQLYS